MLCKCKQTEKLYLSDANKSAFSTFSKASFKASQPPSPRQLPVQVVQNSEYLCKLLPVIIWAPFSLLLGLNRTLLRPTFQDPCVLSTISTVLRTIQVQSLHVGFVPDGLSHHKRRLHRDLAEGEVEILERSVAALRSDCGCFHQGRTLRGDLTLTMGSPSLSTAARAMAPSDRTRQSPKLTTCTFLRCLRACKVQQKQLDNLQRMGGHMCSSPVLKCVKPGLTCAMASVPFLVKVLSFKLRTRSCGL